MPSSSSSTRYTSLREMSTLCSSSGTTWYSMRRSLMTLRRTPSPVSEMRSPRRGRYCTARSGRVTTYLPTSSIEASRTMGELSSMRFSMLRRMLSWLKRFGSCATTRLTARRALARWPIWADSDASTMRVRMGWYRLARVEKRQSSRATASVRGCESSALQGGRRQLELSGGRGRDRRDAPRAEDVLDLLVDPDLAGERDEAIMHSLRRA